MHAADGGGGQKKKTLQPSLVDFSSAPLALVLTLSLLSSNSTKLDVPGDRATPQVAMVAAFTAKESG